MSTKTKVIDVLIIIGMIGIVELMFYLMMNKMISYKLAGILSTAAIILGTALIMTKDFKYSRYDRWVKKYFPEAGTKNKSKA